MKRNINKYIIIFAFISLISIIIFLFFYNKKTPTNIEDIDVTIKETINEDVSWDTLEETTLTLTESTTITEEGIYILSGTITNGALTINTKGYVKLILDNLTIISENGPAIDIENASLVLIELKEDTTNILSDSKEYSNYEDDVEGAIFSRENLVIEGTGTLILNGNKGDALVSKDQLKINKGNFIINSTDDGIRGKDGVIITGGTFTITAGGDGIKSTNEKDTFLGFVKITGGMFNITSTLDGIQAKTKIIISGGTFDITTGGGSSNSSNTSSWGNWKTTDNEKSAKGIKADGNILITDGTFTLDTSDDAIHSNNYLGISSGLFRINSGDDGIHADKLLTIDNGNINISKSYEGLEAQKLIINDGNINIIASDDGINAAGGNDSSSLNRAGANETNYSKSTLTINGGTINVNSSGDGLDANGSIYLNGGTIYVNGPTSDADGALDYDGEFKVSGGTLIASGSSGMAQSISTSSSQYGIIIYFTNTVSSGSTLTITDSTGTEILNYTSSKNYTSLVFSSPNLSKETYTIKIDGDEYQSFTISSLITTIGSMSNKR